MISPSTTTYTSQKFYIGAHTIMFQVSDSQSHVSRREFHEVSFIVLVSGFSPETLGFRVTRNVKHETPDTGL